MRLVGALVVACVLAAAVALPLSRLEANPIFVEDFESYSEGSNISGQGGWFGDNIRVGTGSGLGTKVLNGFILQGVGSWRPSFIAKLFAAPLDPGHFYILSFDAYACSPECGVPSHNSGVNLRGKHDQDGISAGWFVCWLPGYLEGWIFDARGLTGDPNAFDVLPLVLDRPVHLQVVLDPAAGQAWGVGNFGSGVVTTRRFDFDPSRIAEIDGVVAYEEFRSRGAWIGAEFDNILVFEDPAVAVTRTHWGVIKALFR